jgi:hypothetical protein
MVADIEKAFHQVKIAPEDRRMVRFLWFDDPSKERPEIQKYQFCRLVFGLVSSPAILTSVLQQHLAVNEEKEPKMVSLLRKSFYIYDFAGGAFDDNEAGEVYEKSQTLMSSGGFTLRKWHTNSKHLQEKIATDRAENQHEGNDKANNIPWSDQECKTRNDPVKVLGIPWNVDEDTLFHDCVKWSKDATTLPATKRPVLQFSAKIFDPIGLLTPFTIKMKVFFQELCLAKVDWDDELKGELLGKWKRLVHNLNSLKDIKVPRCYFTRKEEPRVKHELHGFSDASNKAFAAVVYLRTEHANGDIEINLVASKTRVAPIKRQSIPRLELLGATILVRLVKSVKEAMSSLKTPPEVFLWSDSYTVLCWIRNDKTWKPYVQNRVKEIRELFDREKWRFCPGEINIADLPSRGCSAEELVRNHSWWKGPEFLNHSPEYWPQVPQQSYIDNEEKALAEIKKTSRIIVYSMANPSINNDHESFDIGDIIDINRYSTKLKLLRVTATVIRYVKRWRNPRHKFESAELTAQELQEAEIRWIQTVQEHEFQHELDYLKGVSKTPTPVVSQLGLFRDDDGLIRCDGRIENSSQQKESKQPILLPATHYFTELLIKEQHEVVHHNGIRDTLNSIRQKYWIQRGREAVKRIVRCVVCRKIEAKPFPTPKAPKLPACRVSEEPPFSNTGIDFAGPVYVKKSSGAINSNDQDKVYIALFTCASTRALHLELVENMSAATFLQAFRRFSSRRGLLTKVLTDNAKTFKSASKEVRMIGESKEVNRYFVNRRITWEFITEKAPWHGGFWERMVRSVKRCLKKAVGRASLSFGELRTLLVEIESTLNNRPLTFMYDDEQGISYALTPSHLIYGRQISSAPNDKHYEIISTNQSLTKRAK